MLRTSHTAVLVIAFALLTAAVQAEPVWVSFDGTPEPIPPTVEILSADVNHVFYDIQVHGMLVSDTVVEGVTYQRLSFPGEGALSDEGLPELPYVCRYVGYAPNATTVLAAGYLDEVELWNYQVFPAQPVNPWTYPPWPLPEFALDSATYASEGPFPDYPLEFLLDTLGVWRDLELAQVGVIPFHYYPAEGRLVVHTHVILVVSFAGGEGLPPEVAESRYHAYTSLVPNFPGLGISAMPHGVIKDKLVIVLGDNSPELRAAIEPLRVWGNPGHFPY